MREALIAVVEVFLDYLINVDVSNIGVYCAGGLVCSIDGLGDDEVVTIALGDISMLKNAQGYRIHYGREYSEEELTDLIFTLHECAFDLYAEAAMDYADNIEELKKLLIKHLNKKLD